MRTDYIADEGSLPGRPTSPWLAAAPDRTYPGLNGRVEADVVVVGGGLAGIATAALLRHAGQSVALVEARRLLGDVTGHTTAKATIQHGPIYSELLERHGELAALTYAEAQLAGLRELARLAKAHSIACGLQRVDSHLVANSDEGLRQLLREADACQRLGLPTEYVESPGGPLPSSGGLRMPAQVCFDPVAFALGLLGAYPDIQVYERSRAVDIREGSDGRTEVVTEQGTAAGWSVVQATNYPFWDRGGYFTRVFPVRSYALAATLTEDFPASMYYGIEPEALSLRRADTAEGSLAIVSGVHHKAGQGGDERDRYRELLALSGEQLPLESVAYHWSTQDNHTADSLPYIGRAAGAERVYMATGFAAWGMTNSLASALLLTDLVMGKHHPWAEVFDPRRVNARASAKTFLRENLNVAKHFVGDRIHTDNPACTHLGCLTTANEAEGTWDCPCHGSRFAADGAVLHGPAVRALAKRPAEVSDVPSEAGHAR